VGNLAAHTVTIVEVGFSEDPSEIAFVGRTDEELLSARRVRDPDANSTWCDRGVRGLANPDVFRSIRCGVTHRAGGGTVDEATIANCDNSVAIRASGRVDPHAEAAAETFSAKGAGAWRT
jgi:hypothetical protein